uniref:Uncharacterized protein n=1 Tax=Roseihalotalea indica TaxID=2867963 RepID=A0AA49GGW2_9BACT|nr:hypothetical protein K4G66_18880 [Tunicatimonas sp. TK19036]
MREPEKLSVKFAAPRLNPEGKSSRHDFVLLHFSPKNEPHIKTQERERSIPIEVRSIEDMRSRLQFRYTHYEDRRPLAEIFIDGFLLDVCILTNLKKETKRHFEKTVILKAVYYSILSSLKKLSFICLPLSLIYV